MLSKAQGLSLNAMVLGGMALVVLAVLIALFSGALGGFGSDLEESTVQECSDGSNGFKYMKVCGEDDDYLYRQYFGNFEEGSIPDDKVCCRSECQAAGGYCDTSPSGTRFPQGDSGCPAGRDCYK